MINWCLKLIFKNYKQGEGVGMEHILAFDIVLVWVAVMVI